MKTIIRAFLCIIHAYFPFDIRILQESEYHTDNDFILQQWGNHEIEYDLSELLLT